MLGADVDAWCYEWVHYGEYPQNERFYVSTERELVRVDWGPSYGHCVGELCPEERVLDGVAPHVRIE